MIQLENEIICGDALEKLQDIPDNSIDLIVTSPPYNIGIEYDNWDDRMPWGLYYEWCRRWLEECYRILKPDGRMCLNHYLSCGQSDNRHAPLMKLNCIAEEIGFKHHGLAVWYDTTLTKRSAWGSWLSPSAPYINSPFEGILVLYKERWKKDRIGKSEITKKEFMEACSGIWKIQPEKDREHPAPFPLELAERCIRMFSWEGDVVLDPFCGKGTTCVAAKRLNRKYIGIDISDKYCGMARNDLLNVPKRLEEFE